MSRVINVCIVLCFMCAIQCTQTQFAAGQDSQKQDENLLMNPGKATEKAPDQFTVEFDTTKGKFTIEVNREWSPNGADRFYNLVKIGYFDDIAIFRAIEGFMFQFGIHGDPDVSAKWRTAKIDDDPGKAGVSNKEGYISFAMAGKNTRTTQFFINLGDNSRLDASGFTPFGKVTDGMDVVRKINTEYGENSRDVQGRFQAGGNEFIKERFPNLDFIKSVKLIEGP